MSLDVREMKASEASLVVDYFLHSSPEHLELMGVDPTRLPRRQDWLQRIERTLATPVEQREGFLIAWLADDQQIGFSSADKIVFGERANMHLHVIKAELREKGIGAECVRRSADLYFDRLRIRSLICEPNAFNVRPNRTLQAAGFRYVKTYMTVPGPLNYHQAVTRWVMTR